MEDTAYGRIRLFAILPILGSGDIRHFHGWEPSDVRYYPGLD